MSKKSPEDAFYDNLLLGLNSTLSNVPRICNVTMEKRSPCEKSNVMTWEQRHGVYLPEDMKKFYLSTDGFLLHWSYQYAPNDIRRVGYIQFPQLVQITLLRENVEPIFQTNNETSSSATSSSTSLSTNLTSSSTINSHLSVQHLNTNTATTSSSTSVNTLKDQWGNPLPLIGPKTKIFELNTVNEVAKVCLIYDSSSSNNPKIYLLELDSFKWVFLAENFSEYLRMAIAHLGLPYWELCFASCGLPSWTEQLFLLLAPHLLEENEPRRARLINPAPEHPYNIVDPNIFRVKVKSNASKTSLNSKHKYEGKK
ncbi:tubulin polyglutamylase complex subunit 2 [Lucilia sericata]|uniref:tubulin polyglutamylase complex subunit 2 n=1 Tax=Lucilia sericata TaxID=13632 RepID=UPI0018A8626A|nr:tubulin polyglutamylase complex subunit 2 [Lucilia sericata]